MNVTLLEHPLLHPSLKALIDEQSGLDHCYRFRAATLRGTDSTWPDSLREGRLILSVQRDRLTREELSEYIEASDVRQLVRSHTAEIIDLGRAECVMIESVLGGGKPLVWLQPWVERPEDAFLLSGYLPYDLLEGATLLSDGQGSSGLRRAEYTTSRRQRLLVDYDSDTGLAQTVVQDGVGARSAWYFLGRGGAELRRRPACVIHTVHVDGDLTKILVYERLDNLPRWELLSTLPSGMLVNDLRREGVQGASTLTDRAMDPIALLGWASEVPNCTVLQAIGTERAIPTHSAIAVLASNGISDPHTRLKTEVGHGALAWYLAVAIVAVIGLLASWRIRRAHR